MLEGYPEFVFCLMVVIVVILSVGVVWLKGRVDFVEDALERQVASVADLYERLAEDSKEVDKLKNRINELEARFDVTEAYVNCMFKVNVMANSAMLKQLRRKDNENSRRSKTRKN